MTHDLLQLAGGGLLLYFGAEWLVAGATALALSVRVRQIIVGLTVVWTMRAGAHAAARVRTGRQRRPSDPRLAIDRRARSSPIG